MKLSNACVCLAGVFGVLCAGAAEFHVTNAQELQTALTAAASNGEGDTILLAAGYYAGVVTFNSAEAMALTIQTEEGVASHEVTLDGAGLGSALSLTATAAANLTVRGLSFSRHCGNAGKGALYLSTSASGVILVDQCQFIAANGVSGMGVVIGSAQSATVRDCVATRDATSYGDGIYISGVTGMVLVERNAVKGGGAAVTPTGRGITVINAAATQTTIRDNTVSRCRSSSGGGIWVGVGSGTATLTGNTVSENYAHYYNSSFGGGIYMEITSGTATLASNTLRANSAGYYPRGGGLYAKITGGSGSLNLTGNTVIANTVSSGEGSAGCEGGGIYFTGAHTSSGVYVYPTLTMVGNTVSNNVASSTSVNSYPKGGGVYIYGSQYARLTAMLEDNAISGNRSYGPGSIVPTGGGLSASGTELTLTLLRNRFIGNESYAGGGVYATGKNLKALSNVFAGNRQTQAGYAGGGLYVSATLLDIVNNTVTANTGQYGGGVYCSAATTLNVYNNIIWGNTAAVDGGDVYVDGAASSKIFRSNCAHDIFGIWHVSENNIDAAPMFHDAVNQDYHLVPGSPCLNVGTNDAPSLPDVDIDGEARIVNTTVDIGADEMPSASDTHPADIDADWTISAAEYADYAAAWKTNGVWSAPPGPATADFATRAGFLRQQGAGAYQNSGGKKPVCWTPESN